MTVMEKAFVNAGFKPLKAKPVRTRKEQKCRKCGAPMRFIENTNVMVCTGDIEIKDDNGLFQLTPCTNKFIFTV